MDREITGNVGIGTTNPMEKLDVVGNINASGSVTQGSSRALKKDISYVSTEEALAALQDMRTVKYKYKADNYREEHLGFIAENVPELVAIADRKYLYPMGLTAVLTKVVQEQQRTITAMKEEIEMLKSAVNQGI